MRVPMAAMSVITEQVRFITLFCAASANPQISELERKAEDKGVELDIRQDLIGGLEKRIAEYERTTDKVANSNRKALEDRHNSEKEVQQAKSAFKAAQDAADQELTQAKKRISDLEARIAVLTAPPEVGKLNQLLNEATEKVQRLERRLENANNDGNYARDEYQKATARAGALNSENKALRETNEELAKQASENLAKIQQVQKDTEVKEHLKTIEALRAQLVEKDFELEQLRALKNGRPQTRQTSVPRSPRTSIMSPRNGRFGSSASRGTSPAAPGQDGNGSGGGVGLQFMGQQPGNSRWNHLRD
jgi:chromosome segregation ATPase